MALLEAVEHGQAHVHDLQHELNRVREVLDRTDAVLGSANDTLVHAEHAIVQGRRMAPIVLTLAVGAAITAAAIILYRRNARRVRAFDGEPSI